MRLEVASLPGHFACWRSSLTGRHDTGQLTSWLPTTPSLKILDIVPHSVDLTNFCSSSIYQMCLKIMDIVTHSAELPSFLPEYLYPVLLAEFCSRWRIPSLPKDTLLVQVHNASSQLTPDFPLFSGSRYNLHRRPTLTLHPTLRSAICERPHLFWKKIHFFNHT